MLNRKMNSSSIFGPLAILIFVYYTPIQGQTRYILNNAYVNGQSYESDANAGVSLNLIRIHSDNYEIQEIITSAGDDNLFVRATFVLNAFHTMLRNYVLIVTNENIIQMELASEAQAQHIYSVSVRNTMSRHIYSYDVIAVYKYGAGCILTGVTISGFSDTTPVFPVHRIIIHSGVSACTARRSLIARLVPHIMWTAGYFNYCIFDRQSVVVTLLRPADGTYDYYLIIFEDASECAQWRARQTTHISDDIPKATIEILWSFQFM